MLDPENIAGEISDPQGTLKVGNVGDTECVCLSYSGQKNKKFTVVYNGRELSSLLAAIKKGAELAPSAKPRSTVRLAALPPKPVRLQVVLVAPEGKSPLVILRFVGPGWKQDIFSQPDALVELFTKVERRAPMPGVVGILDRFGTNVWMIEGQSLTVTDQNSHGTGYFGEYIHHSEVPEGQVVRAWPKSVGDKMVVCAFEFAQKWEPTQSPDLPQGQQGDRALSEGLVRQSRETHALLSKTMYETKAVDPVWSGKIALASMIGDIMMSDDKAGGSTWSGEGGNPVLKIGVQSLRDEKVSGHDGAIFSMISSYYHAKFTEPKEAVSKINEEMTKALNYAHHNAPEMLHMILNNWALLLKEKGAQSGSPQVAPWMEAKEAYAHKLKPAVFCLPDTFPWIKTWQPAKTGEEETPKAPPEEAPQIKPGPVELPPVHDKPVEEASAAPRPDPVAPEDVREDVHEDVHEELPQEPMRPSRSARSSKKKSPLPLVLVGLLLVGAPLGYYFSTKGNGPEVEPTPTPTVTQTKAPVAPKPSPTTIPKAAPLPKGKLLINGFALGDKLREAELLKAGYKHIEEYTDDASGIARYKGPGGTLIASLKMPARLVTALQGDTLTVDGKVVANLDTVPAAFEGDKRFTSFKLQYTVDNEDRVRGYNDARSGIYVAQPLLDAPKGSLALSRKIRDEKFHESLPEDFVNMYMTDGNPLLFQFLGSNRTDRLKYLLDQGANPNQRSWVDGGTALHHCDNVTTAELLLSLGADPAITNNKGQTPAEAAELEELKEVLAIPEDEPTPSISTTPGASATPSASATPGASATPSTSATPAATATPAPTPESTPAPSATP
jgi:hypothetical protein